MGSMSIKFKIQFGRRYWRQNKHQERNFRKKSNYDLPTVTQTDKGAFRRQKNENLSENFWFFEESRKSGFGVDAWKPKVGGPECIFLLEIA